MSDEADRRIRVAYYSVLDAFENLRRVIRRAADATDGHSDTLIFWNLGKEVDEFERTSAAFARMRTESIREIKR